MDTLFLLQEPQSHERRKPQATFGLYIWKNTNVNKCTILWDRLIIINDDGVNVITEKGIDVCSATSKATIRSFPHLGHSYILANNNSFWIATDQKDREEIELENIKRIDSTSEDVYVLTDEGKVRQFDATSKLFREIELKTIITDVACGFEHVLLLSRIGVVYGCGRSSRGQVGQNTVETVSAPKVLEALEPLTTMRIAAGGWHSAAVTDTGDLYTWGWNESGQLGFPSATLRTDDLADDNCVNFGLTPMPVDPDDDVMFCDVACGSRHTVALTEDGLVYTCGWNAHGQLGHSQNTSCDVLRKVVNIPKIKEINAKHWTTLLTPDSTTTTDLVGINNQQ